ncbi:MAG: hypothetical protein PUH24_03785 [Prevotellaceae bacterium]|nr:hypothetical protein [Prevotellaceae bacterium]
MERCVSCWQNLLFRQQETLRSMVPCPVVPCRLRGKSSSPAFQTIIHWTAKHHPLAG